MNIEKDKLYHAIGSGGIAAAVALILYVLGFGPLSLVMGAEIALIVGVGKELIDAKTGGVNDPQDVKADIIGIVIGVIGAGAVILL